MHDPLTLDRCEPNPECPKCGYNRPYLRYSAHRQYVCGESGASLVMAPTLDAPMQECFLVRCQNCDYQWLMHTLESGDA